MEDNKVKLGNERRILPTFRRFKSLEMSEAASDVEDLTFQSILQNLRYPFSPLRVKQTNREDGN